MRLTCESGSKVVVPTEDEEKRKVEVVFIAKILGKEVKSYYLRNHYKFKISIFLNTYYRFNYYE